MQDQNSGDRIGPEGYNFHSEYSVTIEHPIETVFSVLGDGKNMDRVVRLSNLCERFELQKDDEVVLDPKCNGQLSHAVIGREYPAAPPETSSMLLPRQYFLLCETVPILPGWTKTIEILGVQTWDSETKMALYESRTDLGVSVWKLRKFEGMEGNDGKIRTKVTEVIRGKCPVLLKPIVQKTTNTSHRCLLPTNRKC
ncbi:hypothetical protein C8Q75DRAFT_733936 [Abortiporus biennis]|nr:hypothetical protein C8Q75DRAFT_733936 [Abortiporus biennis]